MDPTAERVARNDAIFRDANEQIAAAAAGATVEGVPFICECADPACRAIVRLRLAEYARVRADARTFLNVPGHEVNAEGYARVLQRCDGYVVVEKTGEAGRLVEQLDGSER
jgi:hypothetical protein